jgi:hypothetical protein
MGKLSPFASVIAQALDTVQDVAGDDVQYWRGTQYVSLKAVPGTTEFPTDDVDAATVTYTSADWIFKVSELVIGGVAITPRRGDLVKKTVGSKTYVYEVLKDANQIFRFCDRERTRIRVHTKEKHG